MYTMDHPDFIVCILMENSIGLNRVKIYVTKSALFLFSGFLMWWIVSLTRQLKTYLAASSRISGLLLMRKLLSETVISTVTIQISRRTRLEKKALSGLLTTSSITRSLRELCFSDVGLPGKHRLGLEVLKLFSCSTQLSMKFQLLIKTKIPTNEEVSCFKSLRCCIYHANKC